MTSGGAELKCKVNLGLETSTLGTFIAVYALSASMERKQNCSLSLKFNVLSIGD